MRNERLAIIKHTTTLEDIMEALVKIGATDVQSKSGGESHYKSILFAYKQLCLSMSVYTDYAEEEIFEVVPAALVEKVTLARMVNTKHAEEITTAVAEMFGGYVNDMADGEEWRMIKKYGVTGKDFLVTATFEDGKEVMLRAESNSRMSAMQMALNRLEKDEREKVANIKIVQEQKLVWADKC